LTKAASVPDNIQQAVDYVEHSIHMRAPIYFCIVYGGFYIMTDQTYKTKNPLDELKNGKSDRDDSLIFSHGYVIRKGEKNIFEFSIGDK